MLGFLKDIADSFGSGSSNKPAKKKSSSGFNYGNDYDTPPDDELPEGVRYRDGQKQIRYWVCPDCELRWPEEDYPYKGACYKCYGDLKEKWETVEED